MTLNRREFLKSAGSGIAVLAGATGLITWVPRAYAVARSVTMTARSGLIIKVV